MSDNQTPNSPGPAPPPPPGGQPGWAGGPPPGAPPPGAPLPGTQPGAPGAPPPGTQPGAPGAQPGWGGQPPGGPPPTSGLDPKIGGLLSYLFGWLGGLIIYLTQRDRELRFHGAQSILLSIAVLALYLGLSIVSGLLGIIPVLDVIGGILFFVVFALLWIPVLGLFIFMCVKGYNLEHYKLPYIGDMAERWAVK